MTRSLIVLMAMLSMAAFSARAQGQIRSYTPPGGSTLPNELEYFRPQSGFLDQYNQFVAPKANLANQLSAMSRQQSSDFQAVQNQIKQSDLMRESEAAATGTGASFMNYSHYFGSKGGTSGGSGRRITPQRRYTPALPGVGTGAGLPNGIGSGIGAGGAGIGSGYRPGR